MAGWEEVSQIESGDLSEGWLLRLSATGPLRCFTDRHHSNNCGARWWSGLRAVDAAGNASPLSTQIAPTVGRLARVAGVALVPTRSPSPAPVQIEWQGDPASSGGRQTIDLFDVAGRLQAHFDLPHRPAGVFAWDGHTTRGTLAGAGLYFARMRSGPFTVTGRIVLLR